MYQYVHICLYINVVNWLKITVTAMTWPQVTNQLSPREPTRSRATPHPILPPREPLSSLEPAVFADAKYAKMTNIEGMDIAEITLVKNSFSLYASIKSSRKFCYPNEWSKDRAWSDSAANLWLDIDPMDNAKCCSSTTPGGDLNHQCPLDGNENCTQNTSMVELTELVQPSGVWPFDRLFAEVPFQRHGWYSDLVLGIGAGCHSPLSL